MRHTRYSKIGLLSSALLLFLHSPGASGETTLVKTSKGYRLSILPVMGAESVERKAQKTKGRVRIQTLRETVYGSTEERSQNR